MNLGPGLASQRIACACAASLILLAAGAPAHAELTTSVSVATGQYGMRREIPHAAGFELQLRLPWSWNSIRPNVGVLTNGNGGAYVFSGLVAEFSLPLGLELRPGFAPGVILANNHGGLGYPIEFRSSLELSYLQGNAMRVGVELSHISNARLGNRNPGVETLMLTFAFPAR